MLYEKYEPKSLKDFIGNKKQIAEIMSWLKSAKKPLLLTGQTGSGKTLLIKLIAKEMNYEVTENPDIDELLRASKERSIFYSGKLFVLETGQSSGMRGVSELMKVARPLILITNELYDRRLANIRRLCKVVKLEKLAVVEIANFLKNVCKNKKMKYSDDKILEIAKNCSGDIRAALIDMETYAGDSGHAQGRGVEENIFELLKKLSKADLQTSRRILSDMNIEQVFLWAEENVVNEYRNIEDIALVYELLAKADLFRARIIKRQSWTLQKYYAGLLSASFLKKKKSAFVIYKTPFFARKNHNDSLLEKIGKKLHVSKKEAGYYIGIIKQLYKRDKKIADEFGFGQEDVDSIRVL